MGEAFDKGGIEAAKAIVAFDGGEAQVVDETLLIGGQGILCQNTEKALKRGDLFIQLIQMGFFHEDDPAVFQGIDIQSAGLLGDKAFYITDPPPGRGELKDMFKAVLIDGIHAQQSADDKDGVLCHFSFLQEELFAPELFGLPEGKKIFFFVRTELYVSGDVL